MASSSTGAFWFFFTPTHYAIGMERSTLLLSHLCLFVATKRDAKIGTILQFNVQWFEFVAELDVWMEDR